MICPDFAQIWLGNLGPLTLHYPFLKFYGRSVDKKMIRPCPGTRKALVKGNWKAAAITILLGRIPRIILVIEKIIMIWQTRKKILIVKKLH